ncbi:PEP-CTERM sorting domain-containing protein [Chlorobium sp. N1]|uniref:PEP-CTERM sorting domain-containing protein n=1 Tax=Chlorobium sp. N1 TaxID=2491138 RepID=UPI0013F14E61|nr:PEP-CTERM sorting domain-containing protein [Chlorobium sp. N1]
MQDKYPKMVSRLAKTFAAVIALSGALYLSPARAEADIIYLNFSANSAGTTFNQFDRTWNNPTSLDATNHVVTYDDGIQVYYQSSAYNTTIFDNSYFYNTVTMSNVPTGRYDTLTLYYLDSSLLAPVVTINGTAVSGSTPTTFPEDTHWDTNYITFDISSYDGGTITLGSSSSLLGAALEASPVPEPSTYLLLGIGGLAVAFIRKRQLLQQAA